MEHVVKLDAYKEKSVHFYVTLKEGEHSKTVLDISTSKWERYGLVTTATVWNVRPDGSRSTELMGKGCGLPQFLAQNKELKRVTEKAMIEQSKKVAEDIANIKETVLKNI